MFNRQLFMVFSSYNMQDRLQISVDFRGGSPLATRTRKNGRQLRVPQNDNVSGEKSSLDKTSDQSEPNKMTDKQIQSESQTSGIASNQSSKTMKKTESQPFRCDDRKEKITEDLIQKIFNGFSFNNPVQRTSTAVQCELKSIVTQDVTCSKGIHNTDTKRKLEPRNDNNHMANEYASMTHLRERIGESYLSLNLTLSSSLRIIWTIELIL